MNPSILITPNSGEAGKLFSIIPTNGTGDLDVVRATSATRVDENGLIEIPATNLVLRSEEFNDAIWGKSGISITSNTTTSPSGIISADSFTANGTFSEHRITQVISFTSGITYTLSCFVKKETNDFFQLTFGGSLFTSLPFANYNINSGILGTNGGGATSTISNIGNGWYRCAISATANSTGQDFIFLNLVTSSSSIRRENSALSTSVYLWGAQVEQGSTATEYIPTTSVVRTRFAGITQDGSSASNIPRIDYTNGSCPSILVEPQRTNLFLRSEEFDNVAWVKNGVSVTANNTVSPNNTLTADRINNATNSDFISQIVTGTVGITYTFTIYIKNDNSTQTKVYVRNTIDSLSGLINWSGSILTSISSVTGGTLNFMELSNGWYRLTGVFTSVESLIRPRILPDATAGSRSVFLWGAQLEAGSNATSYIPTTTTSVTRNADVISKSGISSLIGQTEGTIYCEFYKTNITEGIKTLISIKDVTFASNSIIVQTSNNTTNISLTIIVNSTFYSSPSLLLLNGKNKIIVTYNTSGSKLFLNGVLAVSVSNIGLPVMDRFFLGNLDNLRQWGAGINKAFISKTAISDTEAIQLTTL